MRRAVIACLTLAAFTCEASPALGQTAAKGKSKATAHVYLLRGFMNVFSPGIDTLADKLQRRSIYATVHNHMESSTLAEQAIENCKSGRERSIILIGHSLGAVAAVTMAERLDQARVKVGLVVALDPSQRTTVHGNVSRLVNYYLSDGFGVPVERGADFRGSLQNNDLKGQADLGHVSLTTSEAIQQKIISSVVAALSSSCT
jgi:pimeloyl-ACP methyl ester carboxylesterase